MKRLLTILIIVPALLLVAQEKEKQEKEKQENVLSDNVSAEEYFGITDPELSAQQTQSVTSEDSKATAALPVKTFTMDAENIGAIANSVNQFTGDVNMPINLISLPGENGLNVSVSAFYSSNVHTLVDTWNKEAPTGILGLGWSMDYPKIIADHKNTGARADDDFYIMEGSSMKLICINRETTYNEYITEIYQPWKIRYYFNDEKWEVTKEDGTKYIYGDDTNNPTAIQYLVKWGNWIGNSSQS